MFIPLLLGCVTVFISMSIQIVAVVYILQYLFKLVSDGGGKFSSRGRMTYVISVIMIMLFIGNLFQAAIWAVLFMAVGEFNVYSTAFYHSLVNFASLGYGDIVMSEKWRLLGAIEASNGVLMFGLSAGTLLSLMNLLLTHDTRVKDKLTMLKNRKRANVE